jgi:hypothetical protein
MTAPESQATADLDLPGPAYGPQPPDLADLYAAQDAPLEAGLSNAEYDHRLTERSQTEAAYLDAYDRDLVRALEAEAADPELEAEPEPLPDPDPEVGGWPGWSDRSMLAPEPERDAEAEAEAEAEWADNWDSADSHAYMDRVEAGLEPEAEL